MTHVTWFGAWGYCKYFETRLPTEMEWEKAARGTDERPFPWGDEIQRSNANFYSSRDPFEDMSTFGSRTSPVGFYNGQTYDGFQTVDSASPYGLYDMPGNVWQWTGDVYEGMHYRFLRGGSKDTYDMDLPSGFVTMPRPHISARVWGLDVCGISNKVDKYTCTQVYLRSVILFPVYHLLSIAGVPMLAQLSITKIRSKLSLYIPLIKSLQTSLLLLTGVAGYLSAHTTVNWLHFWQMLPSLFLAIAGYTILNMWWDQDIDAKMKRTHKRPTSAGQVTREEVFNLGAK